MIDYFYCIDGIWLFLALFVIIIGLMILIPVLWEGYKARKKLKQDRKNLYYKRMNFSRVSDLPDRLNSWDLEGPDELTNEELYNYLLVLYNGLRKEAKYFVEDSEKIRDLSTEVQTLVLELKELKNNILFEKAKLDTKRLKKTKK